jgi:hypothetical protein
MQSHRYACCASTLAVGLFLATTLAPAASANDFSVVGDAAKGADRALIIDFAVVEPAQYIVFALGNSQTDLFNPIADPTVRLVTAGNQVVDTVDDWSDHLSSKTVLEAFDEFGVFLEAGEAAMVVKLNPGSYRMFVENGIAAYGKTRAGITRWGGGSGEGVGGNTPTPKVKPGKWSGPGNGIVPTCLNVSEDGKRLTPHASNCSDAMPFSILGPFSCGASLFGDEQLAKDVPIDENGEFKVSVTSNAPWATTIVEATGKFTDGAVSGTVKSTQAFMTPPVVLECAWNASPAL